MKNTKEKNEMNGVMVGSETLRAMKKEIEEIIEKYTSLCSRIDTALLSLGEDTENLSDESLNKGGATLVEVKVTRILRELGVPANYSGYQFLREAIVLTVEDYTYAQSITKLLYPEVAKRFNSTPVRVERSIRHAVETVFVRGSKEVINTYFGNSVNVPKGRATNSEFIATLADRIRMDLKSAA